MLRHLDDGLQLKMVFFRGWSWNMY